LSGRTRDGESLGRCWSGGNTTNVLTTSSELASWTGGELGRGTDGRVSLGGSGRRVVGVALRRDYEKVKRIMLLGMERIRTSRWVGIVVNLCLRGKVGRVGGRTLVMLSIVSPVVALANERLGVAPG
jgi:hypothetical protein